MRDELTGLLEIFHKIEEAGGKATLSITTSMGLTRTMLEIVSPTAQLLQLLHPRHQLRATRQLAVDAAATVAQLQEPAVTSRQLPVRLPWLR